MSKPGASQRVLIVGWDGGTWRVFRPLVEKGLMPRLKSLMDRGTFGTLMSTIPPVTPPAWATLMTGLRPERHGIFSFMEGMLFCETVRSRREASRPVSSLSLRAAGLLDLLGKAGRRVMCVNLPMSYPPRAVNGIVVSGMLTPQGAQDFTYPPELKDELSGYVIDIVHSPDPLERGRLLATYGERELLERCIRMVKARGENARRLGQTHPFDFAMVVFTATDRVFHRLWPEVEALGRTGEPTTEVEKLLRDFFVQLDASLGELVDAFPDAVVMLASDHGFGPRAEHAVFPDVYLERQGFQVRRGGASKPRGRSLRRRVRRALRRTLEAVLPSRLARKVVSQARDRQTRMLDALDPERSVAHFVSFDNATFGAVRLLAEAKARLSEAEQSDLKAKIITSLGEMRDPQTAEAIVARSWTREQLFGETVVDFLPEIIVEFHEKYSGRIDPDATTLVGGPPETHRGMHRTDGMFVLSGKPVRTDAETAHMHLADVAPTVLYLSGLAVPTSMQGEARLDLLREEYVSAHPVTRDDSPPGDLGAGRSATDGYTPEQERSVREHLRRLGYLD